MKTVKITHVPQGDQPIRFPAGIKYLEVETGDSWREAAKKWAEDNKVRVVSVEVL
jgi:hypothetical protein